MRAGRKHRERWRPYNHCAVSSHSHPPFRHPLALACALAATALVIGHAHASPAAQISAYNGTWASIGCESRPGAPFAQRLLELFNGTYKLSLTLFSDGKCTIPTMAVTYAGAYRLGAPSTVVPGATDVTLTIANARLAPLNTASADLLNTATPGTCGTNAWYALVEQDIVPSGGCSVLGINLRAGRTQYDIVGMQDGQLFLGQGVGAGGNLNSPALRPTAYGPPLTRLGDAGGIVLLPDSGADLSHMR